MTCEPDLPDGEIKDDENKNKFGNKIILVPPPDYDKIRAEVVRLRSENEKLKKIISFGNISTLETLIAEYIDLSRTKLRKIAVEIQHTDYSPETFSAVGELLKYLNEVTANFGEFILSTGFEGEVKKNHG